MGLQRSELQQRGPMTVRAAALRACYGVRFCKLIQGMPQSVPKLVPGGGLLSGALSNDPIARVKGVSCTTL